MPGLWLVCVSRQFHSREPPGKSFASLYGSASPSTSSRPQETSVIRGERLLLCIIKDSRITDRSRARGIKTVRRVTSSPTAELDRVPQQGCRPEHCPPLRSKRGED